MLKKKKQSRKMELPHVEVNVIPMMDAMTTMLFFLVALVGASKFSVLEGMSPKQAQSQTDHDEAKFQLTIDLESPEKISMKIGPVSKTKGSVNLPDLLNHLESSFTGSESTGYKKSFKGNSIAELKSSVVAELILLKKTFPNEYGAVLQVSDAINYQQMIDVLGMIRESTPIPGKEGGALFPQVSIREREGEIL